MMCQALSALLEPYAGLQCHVLIEESQAMPGQGTRSMLTIGFGYGLWWASLPRCGFPITVWPAVWKRSMGLSKDKEASRLRAQQLYPGAGLPAKKHHGRGEALVAWRIWAQAVLHVKEASERSSPCHFVISAGSCVSPRRLFLYFWGRGSTTKTRRLFCYFARAPGRGDFSFSRRGLRPIV